MGENRRGRDRRDLIHEAVEVVGAGEGEASPELEDQRWRRIGDAVLAQRAAEEALTSPDEPPATE